MNTTDIVPENETAAPQLGQANDQRDIELEQEILENLRRGRSHLAIWRQGAREDYDFFAGNQWDQQDAAKLSEQGRPAVVFNRVVRTVNAVSGVEVQNRQEVKYFPRRISTDQPPDAPTDAGYAEALNEAAAWVRDQTDAEDEESDSFQDNLICGMGWTETRMDYDDDPQGIVRKDRLDPLTMLYDPDSTKRNLADAKWVASVKEFSKKEAKALFPDAQIEAGGTFWNDDHDLLVHDQTDEWKYVNDYSDQLQKAGKISVVQYQYYRKEPVYIVLTPDGNIVNLNQKKYSAMKSYLAASNIHVVKIHKKVYKQCFLIGNSIVEQTDLGCDHFTLRCMTGIRDRNRNYWFGLVALMKDPQRWANKWLSQIQHILNTNSKGGLLIEEGAVKNRRTLEDDWASPDGIVDLNPGGLAKIKEKEQARYPEGIDRLLNYAINAINDIPGVNLEMLGMANRDQAIGLETTRKDAGITVLANFFDSLRRYRKTDGRILAYFIREYIADGRLIRIVGEEGVKYIPLMKDKVAFEYDIIVDDAPTSPNTKDKAFKMLLQLIPLALSAGIPVPKEILDYFPIPQDLIQKWKQQIAETEKPDPQAEAIQQQITQINMILGQISVDQAQADVAKTQSETMKNMATAEKEKSVGEEQSALAMQKFGVLHGDQQIKSEVMQKDQQRKDLELMLNQYRKMLEVQLDARIRQQTRVNVPSLSQIQ